MNIYTKNNTIAAVATPLGTGGVGIIRISGDSSEEIINKIFTRTLSKQCLPVFKPNRIYYGWIHRDMTPVDEVIVLCFRAPNSFTGEDVFEIQCHGGVNVVQKILALCLETGAVSAEPGEFSKRAFMNGKISLNKAEAVLDIIHARTNTFSQVSAFNLSGKLSEKINFIRKELINLLSMITAAVDFPEEVEELEYLFISDKISFLVREINTILTGAVSSNLMRHGVRAVIAGRPNAGKSSLFNALLDMQRAIVTDIPGTTRDIIQESVDIDGIPLILLDTAGMREFKDEPEGHYIESLGINLTKEALESADIIIYIYDMTQGLTSEDYDILKIIKDSSKLLKVGSKLDLVETKEAEKTSDIKISSRNKTGLDCLRQVIKQKVLSDTDVNREFCTNTRQQECLKNAKDFLLKAQEACNKKEPQDLISIDIKSAIISLGEITGEIVSEEIIDNIFSNFCIGK